MLLLDEPTSHLDLDHRCRCSTSCARWPTRASPCWRSSTTSGLAARYADRIAVVRRRRPRAPSARPPRCSTAEPRRRRVPRARGGRHRRRHRRGLGHAGAARRAARRAAQRGPRVLVISGRVHGRVAHALARARRATTCTCGALNRGDTDQAVAEALGLPRVDLPPFGAGRTTTAERRVRGSRRRPRSIVVAATPVRHGEPRRTCGRWWSAGKPLVIVDTAEERDFARGEARRYLAAAAAAGRRHGGRRRRGDSRRWRRMLGR